MNEIMRWLAHYNTLVIQIVFTIVLVLLAIYVYRLFYVPQSSSEGASGADLNEMTEKISQLMKANASAHVTSATAANGSDGSSISASANTDDPVVLKAEINRLKEQLNEAERKIFDLTPSSDSKSNPSAATEAAFGIGTDAPGASSANATLMAESNNSDATAKIQELQKTIDQLQARLDEYDIISEDIAELSTLRNENAQLKLKVEALTTGVPVGLSKSEDSTAATTKNDVDDLISSVDPVATSTEAVNGDVIDSALADSLIAATDSSSIENEAAANVNQVEQNVNSDEKKLLEEFEKSTEKGS